MVAGKSDLTFRRFRFRCNFQTVQNLQKMDHGNEFRGSKNGGNELWGGLKWPKNGRKSQKSGDKTVQPPSGSPARSRCVRWRLAVKFYGRHRPVVAHLKVRRVYSNSGRWCLVWFNLPRRANGQNDPTRSQFGELLPRVFGAQKVSWGLGFHLESQTMFI